MELYYSTLVFIFGLLLGSFYNVVGYRIPNNMSIVKPGSFCPKCKHELKWYELIPVFSFIIQGGKCRKCKCKISFFYPIIELLTGILFLISYLIFGFSGEFVIAALTASFLVIVIVSDFNYLVIPDEVTLFFSLISIVLQFFLFDLNMVLSSLVYGFILFGLMYFIMLLGSILMREEALGGGDVKIMFFVGTVLSVINPIVVTDFATYGLLINTFFEIFIASCLAAPFAFLNFMSKKERIVPFGPFILAASLILFLTSFDIYDFLLKI